MDAEPGAPPAAVVAPLPLHGSSMLGRPTSADVTAMSVDDDRASVAGSSTGSSGEISMMS